MVSSYHVKAPKYFVDGASLLKKLKSETQGMKIIRVVSWVGKGIAHCSALTDGMKSKTGKNLFCLELTASTVLCLISMINNFIKCF